MFLTVTANSALDRVFFIKRFIPGTTMRPDHIVESVGGKGFDASVVLRALGQETLAMGIVAGETGKHLASMLEKYGIAHDLKWVEGETRIAQVIVETECHRHSHVVADGYSITDADCQAFFERFHRHLTNVRWIVGGGSLPKGAPLDFFARVVRIAAQAEIPVLIDCAGEPARLAASKRPTILKMNHHEFQATFDGVNCQDFPSIFSAAQRVFKMEELDNLVITCGSDGILALTQQGSYRAVSPQLDQVNAAGAGDAVSASLVWRLSEGDTWKQALRWAAATSAAVVLTEGTADCCYSDIMQIYPHVMVERIE